MRSRPPDNRKQPRSGKPSRATVYFELHKLAAERERLLLEEEILLTKHKLNQGRLAEINAAMGTLEGQARQARQTGLDPWGGGETLVRNSAR